MTQSIAASPGYADAKYYEVAPPRSLAERLVAAARDRIHADFLRLCRPGPDTRILDVGVSDVLNDAANVLERTYPHRGNITAVGSEPPRNSGPPFLRSPTDGSPRIVGCPSPTAASTSPSRTRCWSMSAAASTRSCCSPR